MPNVSQSLATEALSEPRSSPLIVVGFSARALAEAVADAGWTPIIVDHFSDQDSRQLSAASIQIRQWGVGAQEVVNHLLGLPAVALQPASACVLLGGGTENWPELVQALHQRFRVLGPSVEQLRQLRCCEYWKQTVQGTGIRLPETGASSPSSADSAAASWLVKPLHSAGGVAVRRCPAGLSQPSPSQSTVSQSAVSYQREIQGRVLGAQCVLTSRGVHYLGTTQAWSAVDWPGPSEFIYRGSWGPVELSTQQQHSLEQLCRKIHRDNPYCGWLQFDLIEDSRGELWLLEINPRWTAGMEVLWLAGINAAGQLLSAGAPELEQLNIAQHTIAQHNFTQHKFAQPITRNSAAGDAAVNRSATPAATVYGKAIVYAERPTTLTAPGLARWHALPRAHYADLPAAGTAGQTLAAGQPLLTVRGSVERHSDLQQTQAELLAELQRLRLDCLEILET